MANPSTTPKSSDDELAGVLQRTEIQHRASSVPGREIVQVLTEIPCGVESGCFSSNRAPRTTLSTSGRIPAACC